VPSRLSWSRRLIFSITPLIVFFALAEGGLLLSGWPPAPTAPFEHNEPFWTADPDLRSFAMSHKEESTTFPMSTNGDGLRAPLFSVEADPGTWRIMALGCSTTFGWGVRDEETYPARLGALLRDDGADHIEVVNGGQPGYTSFQGRWLWDRVLKDYRPDVVLIGYIVQDSRKAGYSDKSQAILQNDARFLKDNILYQLRSYLFLRSALGQVQIRAKEREGDQGGVYRVPPEDYAENLRYLIRQVRDQGGQPVLFGYPLERSGYTTAHRGILAAAGEVEGVPVFDPQAQMEAATHGAELYFPRDRGHANAAGNALIAGWMKEFLKQQTLLGGER
jgi:lysophospholipase L1-like esterase